MRTRVIFIFVLFSVLFIIHDVTHSEVFHPTRLRVVPQEFVNSRLDRTAAGDAYETSPTPHTQIAEKSPPPNEPLDPPEQGRVYLLAEGIQYPSVGAQNCGPLCYHNTRKVVGWSYEHCVAGWETGIENDKEVMGTDWDVFFGLWSNPQQLSESASDAGRLDMVRDINGTVHCVWHQNHNLGGSSYEVYYSKYQFGSFEWSEPVLLSTVDTIEGNFPTVHVDNAGHVTARWSELLRDSVGNIISYYGYRTIRSDDWGETWDSHTMQWATRDPFRLWGAGCSDHVTGDIYLVDAEPYSDYGDAYADLVVYYYDRSFESWFGPDMAAYGGSTGEFYHDISHVSATVGPDGICYILFAQTTNPDPGYLYVDSQVYAPVGAQLFIISGQSASARFTW